MIRRRVLDEPGYEYIPAVPQHRWPPTDLSD